MINLLEGVRVVETASFVMGPIAGRILADWGAEVIKIEPSVVDSMNPSAADGDRIRGTGMARGVVNGDPCCYEFVSRNKKSVAINTMTPEGRKIQQKLCASADIVISTSAPAMQRSLPPRATSSSPTSSILQSPALCIISFIPPWACLKTTSKKLKN